ncbi:cry [Symbiodinium natans]|uniref:Cry protein n=1 Tax=Symbiodinium natans TaxID=878477 RepID=A0A812P7R8_9DINO|nr:cry [Symbiodinium natans]
MSTPPDVDSTWWGNVPSLSDLGYGSEELREAEESRRRSAVPWRGGESCALARLQAFIWERRALKQYVGTTDWTASGKCTASNDQTSKLSPYLAFGCLSPRLLYWEIQRFEKSDRCKGCRGLVNSLLWRDFYRFIVHYAWGNRTMDCIYNLMYHLFGPMSCGSLPGGHKTPTQRPLVPRAVVPGMWRGIVGVVLRAWGC